MEMSSSAGDWTGLLIQRLNKQLHAVVFFQENSYPKSGFDVVTQSYPIVSVSDTIIDSPESLFDQVCNLLFNEV